MFDGAASTVQAIHQRIDAFGESPRYWKLNAYEALWNGQHYEGRPSFWDTSVPLRERAPAIQSMLPRTAGRRLAQYVFGERTFPSVVVESAAFGVTLSAEHQRALSALVQEIVRRSDLRRKLRAVLEAGLKCGSACVIVGIVEGQPRIQVEPAKHCAPRLDALGRVQELVIQYKVPLSSGGEGRLAWFRREIGGGVDRAYAPVPCTDAGEPDWSRVPVAQETRIPFTPVVWVRNFSEAEEECHSIDGHPLVEGLEDEVTALDMELSQLYRTALYNGDPQMVRTGAEGEPLGPTGSEAAATAGFFGEGGWGRGWNLSRAFRGGAPATRKGPGSVWDIPAGGDAKLLESSGAGAEIIRGAIQEIRRVVTDGLGVVLADPDMVGSGDLSGRALELLLGPMLDTAAGLRVEYGAALLAIVEMLLRLCADSAVGPGIHLIGREAAMPALRALYGDVPYRAAPLTLKWPDMLPPSWSDIGAAITAARAATGDAAILSRRAALRMIASVAGVEDVEAELAEGVSALPSKSQ